jgi:hypothetical protein
MDELVIVKKEDLEKVAECLRSGENKLSLEEMIEESNDLVVQKKALAESLAANGVEASEDETFGELVRKNNSEVERLRAIYMGRTHDQTSFASLFENNKTITSIPWMDTSQGISFNKMCSGCTCLETIPDLDYSKGTDFTRMLMSTKVGSIVMYAPAAETFEAFLYWNTAVYYACLEISNKCTNLRGCFNPSTQAGEFVVELRGDMSGVKFWGNTFRSPWLTTIIGDLVFLEGVTTDTFYQCIRLNNIKPTRIECDFYIQQATALSLESAKNIVNALVDYSGTENEFTKTLQLSSKTIELLEADGLTAPGGISWMDYITAKGWNI